MQKVQCFDELQQNSDKLQQGFKFWQTRTKLWQVVSGFEFQQIATKFHQNKLQQNFVVIHQRLQVLMSYNKDLTCNKITQIIVLTNLSQNGEHSKLWWVTIKF